MNDEAVLLISSRRREIEVQIFYLLVQKVLARKAGETVQFAVAEAKQGWQVIL